MNLIVKPSDIDGDFWDNPKTKTGEAVINKPVPNKWYGVQGAGSPEEVIKELVVEEKIFTENGQYDTTLTKTVIVNVQGGGGSDYNLIEDCNINLDSLTWDNNVAEYSLSGVKDVMHDLTITKPYINSDNIRQGQTVLGTQGTLKTGVHNISSLDELTKDFIGNYNDDLYVLKDLTPAFWGGVFLEYSEQKLSFLENSPVKFIYIWNTNNFLCFFENGKVQNISANNGAVTSFPNVSGIFLSDFTTVVYTGSRFHIFSGNQYYVVELDSYTPERSRVVNSQTLSFSIGQALVEDGDDSDYSLYGGTTGGFDIDGMSYTSPVYQHLALNYGSGDFFDISVADNDSDREYYDTPTGNVAVANYTDGIFDAAGGYYNGEYKSNIQKALQVTKEKVLVIMNAQDGDPRVDHCITYSGGSPETFISKSNEDSYKVLAYNDAIHFLVEKTDGLYLKTFHPLNSNEWIPTKVKFYNKEDLDMATSYELMFDTTYAYNPSDLYATIDYNYDSSTIRCYDIFGNEIDPRGRFAPYYILTTADSTYVDFYYFGEN